MIVFEKIMPRTLKQIPKKAEAMNEELTADLNSSLCSEVKSLEITETEPTLNAMPIIIKTKYSWKAIPYAACASLPNLPATYTSVRPIKNSKNIISVIGQPIDQLSLIIDFRRLFLFEFGISIVYAKLKVYFLTI
jgi:hypothetical protein